MFTPSLRLRTLFWLAVITPHLPAPQAHAADEKTSEPASASSSASSLTPDQEKLLSGAEQELRDLVNKHVSSADADTAQAAKEVLELLALPRQPAPTGVSLVGKWQVRSLQASDLGVYAYPFFPCEIRREGSRGVVFQKHSGSQRRLGVLMKYQPKSILFLGGSYYEGDKPRGHSLFRGGKSGPDADSDHDSVGELFALGRGHLLLIFSPPQGRGEIYELKKP